MYFALNQNMESFDTYLSFLSDILKNNNQKYIEIFESIISEAQTLSKTNNFYSVNSERFDIINAIAKNPQLIDSIDTSHIDKEDYQKILDFLRSETQIEP